MMTRRATILNVYSVLCRTLIVFVAACYGTIVATAESPVHGPFPYVLDADNTTVRLNQGNTRVPFEALQDGKVYRGIGLFNPMQVTAETSRRGKQSFCLRHQLKPTDDRITKSIWSIPSRLYGAIKSISAMNATSRSAFDLMGKLFQSPPNSASISCKYAWGIASHRSVWWRPLME